VGIARDITESKRADEALRESERRFKLITETIGEVFWMNDPELRKVLYISPAYDRIWGRSRTDAYEHPESFLDAIHPDDREEALTGLAKLQTGAPFELGFRIVRPDGAVVSIWDQAFPVRDATGKLECYVGIARDVSERKRLEDTIRSRSEELARSNEELERFAYVASHDLQEPLRMVASFTQLLSRKYSGKLDETADRYINFAVDGAKRMQQLITDLLAFSRINSRDLDLRPTECDRVVRLTLQNLKVAIDESGAAIECDPLPVLLADAGQLGQMFQNLIGNAIKFRGETPPRIHIAAADRGAEWEFSVRDNGIGIDPKHADRIFQIFQRLHTREQYPGTGIGLAVCKKTVERHGGRLWVESQPGGGSTFLFTMPKAPGNGAGNGTENVR
jgi:PAS domain S-box-containing protein